MRTERAIGISNDVRDLMNSAAPVPPLLWTTIYRASLHGITAALEGWTLVFTAGIGEKSSIVRQRISERLS
jgi:acetate kinase